MTLYNYIGIRITFSLPRLMKKIDLPDNKNLHKLINKIIELKIPKKLKRVTI